MIGTVPMSAAVKMARTPGSSFAVDVSMVLMPAVRDRAAQDDRMEQALRLQVADEQPLAGQETCVLEPVDRAADIGVCASHAASPNGNRPVALP